MTTIRLAWLFARRTGSGSATLVLPIVAFGIVTALVFCVLGGVQAFFSWTDSQAGAYQLLAIIALVLLVVPLLTVGSSAARLSARRRDERLSTLRLLGATTATVSALTVLESTVLALIGALCGVAGYLGLVPIVGLIPFRGAALGVDALVLNPLVVCVVVTSIMILATISAVIGLRAVVLSPLGVRTRQRAPKMHWLRVVIGTVVIVAVAVVMNMLGGLGSIAVAVVVIAAGLGGAIAMLNLIGPWVIRRSGLRQLRRATTAQRLIAARGILESPKAAWRQVNGVAMISFIAVVSGSGLAFAGVVSAHAETGELQLLGDIRTGILVTVAISFLMVAVSVAVNQAASILDGRDLYVSLHRLGMPIRTMDAARRRAVMSPLRIVSIGSALCAAVLVLPLTGITVVLAPLSIAVIAASMAGGIALVWLALRATRPVLRRVLGLPQPV